jgi:hypothetical protein
LAETLRPALSRSRRMKQGDFRGSVDQRNQRKSLVAVEWPTDGQAVGNVWRRDVPRPRCVGGIVADPPKAHSPSPVRQLVARRIVQGPIVEGDDIARFDIERHQSVAACGNPGVDVRRDFVRTVRIGVSRVVNELAGHEPSIPTMRSGEEAHSAGATGRRVARAQRWSRRRETRGAQVLTR